MMNLIFCGTTGNDFLLGSTSDDRLFGFAGNDILQGGLGNDQMVGGLGNDTYYYDQLNDAAIELENEGIDTVYTTLDGLIIPANIENMVVYDFTRIGKAAFGNELSNVIEMSGGDGQSFDDSVDGGGGDDSLLGNAGSDQLIGGDGNDRLDGTIRRGIQFWRGLTSGNDTLTGGAGNDTFVIESLIGDRNYSGAERVLITDFNSLGRNGQFDLIETTRSRFEYTISYRDFGVGSSTLDAGLFLNGDLVAILQDVTNFSYDSIKQVP